MRVYLCGAGKGYVDMSTVNEATSQKIEEAVRAKGGRFVEVSTCTRARAHTHRRIYTHKAYVQDIDATTC